MHAPNSDSLLTTTADAVTPAPAPCPEMSHNVPKCPTPADSRLPNLTPPRPSPATLSPVQETAISLLCAGLNLSATAARLGLNRRTLHRWRTTHPAFRAELARRQHDLHDTASRRLRLTLLRAIGTITTEIRSAYYRSDRVKAALTLLRHADLPALLAPPSDPLTTEHCLDQQIRQDRASRNLDPTLEITDSDRDDYLTTLQHDDLPDPAPRSEGAEHSAAPDTIP